MDFSKVCGYTFRFCKVCGKETHHFRLTGEGCVAWLCRNYETHLKEVTRVSDDLVGQPNLLPKVQRPNGSV